MAGKRKPKPLSKTTLVKTMARARVGTVPAEKILPDPRRRPRKHKLSLRDLTDDERKL